MSEQPTTMTDEQIDAYMPVADGAAEANAVRVEVQPGMWGTEYEEVAAWSLPLVRSIVRAAVADAVQRQWISTDERMPEDGQSVAFVARAFYMLANLNGKVLGGVYRANSVTGGFSVPGMTLDASHWMPLPAPPAAAIAGA